MRAQLGFALASTTDPEAHRMNFIDGGFVKSSDIDQLEQAGCRVFLPVPNSKQKLATGVVIHDGDLISASQMARDVAK